MSRTAQYMQGRREALKWAITYLHAKAEKMNSIEAMAVLNVTASDIGDATRDGGLPKIKRKSVSMYSQGCYPKSWWRQLASRFHF